MPVMLVPFTRRTRRSPSAYTFVPWLLAAAFMLRALLPVGYMPDADALKRGDLAIAFCTADGTLTTIPFDSKLPAHAPDGEATYAHCPFGALKPLALIDPPALPASTTRIVLASALAAPEPESNRLEVAGPPLGSRAPPAGKTALLA